MIKADRILFIVNGLGLGNSTRCDAVIEKLQSMGKEIDVLTSGNGLDYFNKKKNIKNIWTYQTLQYGVSNGRVSMIKTLLLIPTFVISFFKNVYRLSALLKFNKYSAIVIDSDYTILALRWRNLPPVIAINNAAVVVERCRSHMPLPANIRGQYLLEKLDYFFHCLVPDIIICPTVTRLKNKKANFVEVAPIVRAHLLKMKVAKVRPELEKRKVLVMLSGSAFTSSAGFLPLLQKHTQLEVTVVGEEGVSQKNIHFKGKLFNNYQALLEADLWVINGGFSSISEALLLKKPTVVIPIENHAEQWVNAKFIVENGLGLIARPDNVAAKVNQLVTNFESFRQANQNFNIVNGVERTAELIAEEIAKQIEVISS